jgi:exodeoxyribonuclease V alpha subunit
MLVHGITLREGDKVMQIKNNYNIVWEKDGEEGTGIFNGDVGVLQKIDTDADRLEVVFDDRLALYTSDQAV